VVGGKVAVLIGGIKSFPGLISAISGSRRRTAALKLIPESAPTYPVDVNHWPWWVSYTYYTLHLSLPSCIPNRRGDS
jgi:hypothetical protein